MKRLLILIPLLLLMAGCGTAKTTAPASGPGSAGEPIVVDATVLVKDFDANKINAQDKYNGKVVQTAGFVSNISSALDNFYIQFKPTADPYYFGTSFQCYVSKEDAAAVANGQQVTVKGTVDDALATLIQMKDCSVVK